MNEILCNTKYLQLKSTPSKNGANWVYSHRPNAKDIVIILAHTKDEVLFIIEERPPIVAESLGKYSIGVVAGLVGDERENETIEEAIRAELLEEAGLITDDISIKSCKVASSPGCTSEVCTIAFAKIKDKKTTREPIDDGGIIVERVWVKKNKIYSWLKAREKEGYVITAHALATLFYLYE
jgi:ADP-ribose pyrophosphatase